MARRDMELAVSSGVAATEVEADNALDYQEAYESLSKLPVNRVVNVNFPVADYADLKGKDGTVKITAADLAAQDARRWVKQGKAWAAAQEVEVKDKDGKVLRKSALEFARKGDIKGIPNRVTFRIYVPRAEKEVTK